MTDHVEKGAHAVLGWYRRGVFPMAMSADDPRLYLVDPDQRGILPLNAFHLPKKLARRVRANIYEIRIDTAFAQVIRACAAPAEGRENTWINSTIIDIYTALHRRGYAHSIECWSDGVLAGGLYGVALGGVFFGESMYSARVDASKLALVHLVAGLIRGGFTLLDVQFVTEHLRRFGAREVARQEFHRLLSAGLSRSADFPQSPSQFSGAEAVQLVTQTS